jgi:hypothetical protein
MCAKNVRVAPKIIEIYAISSNCTGQEKEIKHFYLSTGRQERRNLKRKTIQYKEITSLNLHCN